MAVNDDTADATVGDTLAVGNTMLFMTDTIGDTVVKSISAT